MKIKSIAQWFGSNRQCAENVSKELGKLKWCGVPFMGGASELAYIQTTSGVANDLHPHVINLARCISDESCHVELENLVESRLFHPVELRDAQQRCKDRESVMAGGLFSKPSPPPAVPDVQWAADYYVCTWFGRGGMSGMPGEFKQNISARFGADGGSSAVRWRSAIESLRPWHEAIKRWEFVQVDANFFIDTVRDDDGYGLYVDAPWPELGDNYTEKFSERQQRAMSERLSAFTKTRVVIRYGDHPLIRELYSNRDWWTWIEQCTVNMKGKEVKEVLIVNNKS